MIAKNFKLAVVSVTFLTMGNAMAATSSATSTAEVLTPIAIAKVDDLSFGNLVIGNGTITISTSGARTKTGSTPLVIFGSSPKAAKFNVTGQGSQTFSIATTGSSTELAGPSGSSPMAFTLITESITGTGAASNKLTGIDLTGAMTSGAATIYAGGIVVVAATQATGTYSGSISVLVEYN